MGLRLQVVAIVVTVALFLTVFELVRRRRLMERYALLWLFSTVVLLGLSVWSQALETLSESIGIIYGPSALFAVAIGFILVLLLHFSLVLSRLSDQTKVLAQEVGRLREKVDRYERERVGSRGAAEAGGSVLLAEAGRASLADD